MGNLYKIGWESVSRRGYPPEVMPIADLREHDLGEYCWCFPKMEFEVLVHNALDQREGYETGVRRLH